MARFTPKFEAKYTELAPDGIQLPGWFYNVPASDFGTALNNGMKTVESIDILSNRLEDSDRKNRIRDRVESDVTPEDDYESLLGKLRTTYAEEGDIDSLTKVLDAQAEINDAKLKREEADRKSKQPRLYGGADGLIEYDPVTKKTTRLYDKPEKAKGEGKQPKFEVPYFDPETLAETKVNVLDPTEVEIARKLNYRPGKPTMWDEMGIPNPTTALKEKQQAETQSRTVTPGAPTAPSWLDQQLQALDEISGSAYDAATKSMQKRKLTAPRRQ